MSTPDDSISKPLQGIFATKRQAGVRTAAAADENVSAQWQAQVLAAVLLLGGAVLACLWDPEGITPFKPAQGLGLFAGFYVAAQSIERLLELVPPGLGTPQAKANRAVVFSSFGFLLGIFAAERLGLHYVSAVGGHVGVDLDVVVTALAIGGGTKPLHDAITRLQKPAS